MKNVLKLSLIAIVLSAPFAACKKYPDGPSISIISRKERMANTWYVSNYYENGVDKTADFKNALQNARLIIDKSGSYSLYYKYYGVLDYNENGTWAFTNDDKDYNTYPTSSTGGVAANSIHHILKLKESELWYKDDTDGSGIVKEYHLKP